ncbi:MAG: hypothetical protein ACM3KM_01075 [Acidobacteriaceae bacterium]
METNLENSFKPKNDWLMRHKLLLFTVTGVFILAGIVFQIQLRSYWKNYKYEPPVNVGEQKSGSKAEWKIYRSEEHNFEFQYPPDWKLKTGEDIIAYQSENNEPPSIDNNIFMISFTPGETWGMCDGYIKERINFMNIEDFGYRCETSDTKQTYGWMIFPSKLRTKVGSGAIFGFAKVRNKTFYCPEDCSVGADFEVKGTVNGSDLELVKKVMSTFRYTNTNSIRGYNEYNAKGTTLTKTNEDQRRAY